MSSAHTSSQETGGSTHFPALSKAAGLVALLGLGVAAFTLARGVQQGDARPLFGWLIGLTYWLSIGIGMLFLLQIWYLFDAGWPTIIRRQYEHALSGFKWIFVLFLPLLAIAWGLFGDNSGLLWTWMNPHNTLPGGGSVGEDVLYKHKEAYLNLNFFTIRVALYFAVWVGLSAIYRKCSFKLDKTGDIKYASIPRKVSTIGVILCAFACTFAAIDWFMSVEYHWFSTMYGVWFFAESMRTCLATTVILLYILSTRGYLKGMVNQAHYYFLGCLMLAFTMFWTYISFCQYFLIYNANIPEETFWYSMRELTLNGEKSSWWWVSMFLVFGQFLFPFLYLLFYKNKIRPKRLLFIAVWMVCTHVIDIYWNILPGRIPGQGDVGYTLREFSVTVTDVAMVLGVGGLMVWSFLRSASREKAIPVRDPRILESLNAHE